MSADVMGHEAVWMEGERRPHWLYLQEAAAYCRLSVPTLRAAIDAGELQASGGGGTGRRILIATVALDDWMERRGRET